MLRRANALSFGREQLADLRSAERPLRPRLRRRLPRHVEFTGLAGARLRPDAAGPSRHPRHRSCRSNRACRRPAPTPTSGCRCGRAPKVCWRSGSRNVIMAPSCGPASAAAGGRAHRGLEHGSRRLHARAGREDHRRRGARVERLARELAEMRPSVAIIGGPPLAHTNGLFSALAVNALNALDGQCRAARRHVLHAADRSRRPPRCRGAERASASPSLGRRRRASWIGEAAGAADRRRESRLHDAAGVASARERSAKIPYIVSFGSFLDETSVSRI